MYLAMYLAVLGMLGCTPRAPDTTAAAAEPASASIRRPPANPAPPRRAAAATSASATRPAPTPGEPPDTPEPTSPTVQYPPQPTIRRLVESAIAEGKLPGAVIAFGSARSLEYLEAFGARAIEPQREAMTRDTIFDLASLTKAVLTGFVAIKLSERGALDLEATIGTYLTTVRPAARRIRVRDLLLHTAGLPSVIPRRDLEGPRPEALARLLQAPLAHTAGRAFDYGDTAYLWLGAVLERAGRAPLTDLGRTLLVEPLGLTSTFLGRVPAAARPRTAPTEWAKARNNTMIRGETHDPRAYRLGGLAGNAGVFSTASDLSRYAQMLLRAGRHGQARLLQAASVTRMTRPRKAGRALRAYGWDVLSGYSRLRGERLSAQAFGHGGFTGTSLWIDPGRDFFLVFLSNRVHPNGQGNVLGLIADITDAAIANRTPTRPRPPGPAPKTVLGIDRIAANPEPLAGKRVAVLVNRASLAGDGRRTLDILHAHPQIQVKRVFAPEHGLTAEKEGHVRDGRDPATGLPVVSLFGKQRRPTAEMLSDVDALVFDLQDVGVRFFTYMSTLRELLAAARAHDREVIVLDRPNPLGAHRVEGPVSDANVHTFVHYHPLPVRHGMTAGELAGLLNGAPDLGARLSVVWMEGYCRERTHAQTGLAWTAPSPNLKTPKSVALYPAVGLLESTNLSVGRGTAAPFAVIGAPWLNPERWVAALAQEIGVPGLTFATTRFTPTSGPFRHAEVPGVALRLADGASPQTVDLGLALAHTLHATHGSRFKLEKVGRMLAHRETLAQLRAFAHYRRPTRDHILGLAAFLEERRAHLHYPSCWDVQQATAP